ncbi:MAG: ABC transporter ATP-binding protein [Lentisphaerae bacterium]|nr:ABC transporter ATP-binding protein [Lentisphaerota bacterium]
MMSDCEYMIQLENVCKSYTLSGRRKLEVLHDVNGEFRRNAWNLLLGASGSGKTTLLNLIGALETADSGCIKYNGKPYDELMRSNSSAAAFRNRKIGFIFQNYQLLPEFTILENVLIPARLAGVPRKKALLRAEELLVGLGLQDRLNHRSVELSGGEQQRAAVARALINDPELILADEPTGNLDSQTGEKLLELFRQLAVDHTIIMITHNESLTACADCVLHLADGRLV